MKITRLDDGSFQLEMTPEDASEQQLQAELETIITLSKCLEVPQASREQRSKERGGYWRYCQAEKALMQIRSAADIALKHIKWLDFPEDREAVSERPH